MELVIAVIILIASMTIALKLISDSGEAQCISEVKAEVDKLKLAMQDLALQSPPSKRTFYFHMPKCGETSVDVLRFVYYNSEQYCRACPGHYAGCWKMEMASYDPDGQKLTQGTSLMQNSVCIDIAGEFTVLDGSDTSIGGQAWDPATGLGCLPLGVNPCPVNEFDSTNPFSCTASTSGVPTNLYTGSDSKASFSTLGRWYASGATIKRTRIFKITLQKRTYHGLGGEAGAIAVCAQPVEN